MSSPDTVVTSSPETDMETRILAVAERLFVERGFHSVSTTEIARETGCNQALVHYYFRTKEKLFNRIFEDKAREVFSQLFTTEMGEGTFIEKLTAMIGIHYEVMRKNAKLVSFIAQELRQNPSRLSGIRHKLGNLPLAIFQSMNRELEQEIAAGNIRPIEFPELLLNVISLNVFLFMIEPVYSEIWGISEDKMEEMLDRRKENNIHTILQSLKP